MSGPRLWGFWTQGKLDMLRDYLQAFRLASKKARSTTYLDLFAGGLDNRDRATGEPIAGSIEVAAATDPPFTELAFFELKPEDLERELKVRYPTRRFRVIEGDCNATVGPALAEGSLSPLAPTFCFIDPDGPDCWWSTLETLASFKRGRSDTKVELWMLFPVGGFTRELTRDGSVTEESASRITRVFGTDRWREIYEARVAGDLDPDEARAAYVNLMRWRLEHDLGYAWTHSFDVYTSKTVLYAMIFATDSEPGHHIMNWLYAQAVKRFPEMAEHARRSRSNQGSLFSVVSARATKLTYEHTPAQPPYERPS